MKKSNLFAACCLFLFMAACVAGRGGSYLDNNNATNNELVLFSFTTEKNPKLAKDSAGVIADTDIVSVLPQGTAVNELVATYTTSGTRVMVGSTVQTSGVTPNNFTSPVTYTVVASNNTIKNYRVRVALNADEAHGQVWPVMRDLPVTFQIPIASY